MVTPTTLERLRAALRAHAPGTGANPAELRAETDANAEGMPIPDGVTVASGTLGGRPVEWLTPQGVDPAGRTVIHLHGGGYCMGSLLTVRPLAANIALAARAAVVSLDYRLAPEGPCPAAIEDVLATYEALLADGVDPARLAIGGDSAGGGLAIAGLTAIRDRRLPLPSAGFGLSPFVILTNGGQSPDIDAELDPMVSPALLDKMGGWYAGDLPPDDPRVSPVNAELAGLPPLLVHAGGAEYLREDILRFAGVARSAGVPVVSVVWPEMFHGWHLFAPRLPAANEAITAVRDWLLDRWSVTSAVPEEAART